MKQPKKLKRDQKSQKGEKTMKDIHTESYANLAKNMSKEDMEVFLGNVDHKLLVAELDKRLDRSVARDEALDGLVTKYEK